MNPPFTVVGTSAFRTSEIVAVHHNDPDSSYLHVTLRSGSVSLKFASRYAAKRALVRAKAELEARELSQPLD